MLSLTKKSDSQPEASPLWHANYRNFDRLPDTKVVRTTFFINTAAIVIAAGMLLWLAQREYTNYNITEQKAEAQRQIDSNKKQNDEAIRLSKLFLAEEKKLNEVMGFIQMPITPTEFIDQVSQSLPKEIAIDAADMRFTGQKTFVIKGRVAGNREQASGIASNYEASLKSHAILGKVFDPIKLNRLDPDAAGGFMTFDISLTISSEKK